MEQERNRNIAVGLTALGGLIGLLALLFLFGYMPSFMQKGYIVEITYPTAGGLYTGSRVRLNGIDVGEVERVQLTVPAGSGVQVTARLQPDIRLPQGITATVASPLLGGASSVELVIDDVAVLGNGSLPTDGSARIEGRIGSLETRFAAELKSAIEGPAAQFEALTASFTELSAEWRAVATNLNALTEQRDTDAVDAGELAGNLATVLARADSRLAQMQEAIDHINAWAGDEKLRSDFKATVSNTAAASANLDATMKRIEQRVVAVADDLSKVTASANQLLATAQAGEGTVGKMLSDPALYNNLNDSAQRLQKALDEARLLIEKWKSEGLPVQF